MFTGISIGIAAAFVWSLTNLIDKHLVDKYSAEVGIGGVFLLSCFYPLLITAIAYILNGNSVFMLRFSEIGILLGAGMLMVSWIFFYLKALEREDASVVMTLLILAPIFSLLFGFVFLHELPTMFELTGGSVMILGALVIAYKPRQHTLNWSLLSYAMAASAVTGLMTSLFKLATTDGDVWDSLFWRSIGMVLSGIVLFTIIHSYRKSFRLFLSRYLHVGVGLNITNETLTLIGDTLFAVAILFAPIVLVQTTEAYQPVFIFLMLLFLSRLGFHSVAENYDRSELIKRAIGFTLVLLGTLIFAIVR